MRVTTCRRNADEQGTYFIIKCPLINFISSFYVDSNGIVVVDFIIVSCLFQIINPFSQRKHADSLQ